MLLFKLSNAGLTLLALISLSKPTAALNPFQSPVPPQYTPPNYYVDEYTRTPSDGYCCKCQAAVLNDAAECLHRCKYAFITDLMDPKMLDDLRMNFDEWKVRNYK